MFDLDDVFDVLSYDKFSVGYAKYKPSSNDIKYLFGSKYGKFTFYPVDFFLLFLVKKLLVT